MQVMISENVGQKFGQEQGDIDLGVTLQEAEDCSEMAC